MLCVLALSSDKFGPLNPLSVADRSKRGHFSGCCTGVKTCRVCSSRDCDQETMPLEQEARKHAIFVFCVCFASPRESHAPASVRGRLLSPAVGLLYLVCLLARLLWVELLVCCLQPSFGYWIHSLRCLTATVKCLRAGDQSISCNQQSKCCALCRESSCKSMCLVMRQHRGVTLSFARLVLELLHFWDRSCRLTLCH